VEGDDSRAREQDHHGAGGADAPPHVASHRGEGELHGAPAKRIWIAQATCSSLLNALAEAGFAARRRDGPFHDGHLFHDALDAYRRP
jgi:hypothetical protein